MTASFCPAVPHVDDPDPGGSERRVVGFFDRALLAKE